MGVLTRESRFHRGMTLGMELLQRAVVAKNPTMISILVDAGVPLNDGYPIPEEYPIAMAKTFAAKWIVDHLFSLGAKDREFKKEHREEPYFEESYDFQRTRGGVRLTRRTWEWVGKY